MFYFTFRSCISPLEKVHSMIEKQREERRIGDQAQTEQPQSTGTSSCEIDAESIDQTEEQTHYLNPFEP